MINEDMEVTKVFGKVPCLSKSFSTPRQNSLCQQKGSELAFGGIKQAGSGKAIKKGTNKSTFPSDPPIFQLFSALGDCLGQTG